MHHQHFPVKSDGADRMAAKMAFLMDNLPFFERSNPLPKESDFEDTKLSRQDYITISLPPFMCDNRSDSTAVEESSFG